ncbi:SemiSWEET family transporter [uncultured Chryseobacterium sp.]|uniref:SemiSWEET family sugar transporter n=1 Tax=uncultured Chryseobacterium sp. TaxID=259322 RepID=UPI00262D5282|nr:SemiSWEET family transporter [uncultured Chryseobacterium sp.]
MLNINPEIIGFVAGGLSSSLFIPQIFKILKEKSTDELSWLTIIIGVVSSSLWLWYGILNSHISMIVTNSVSILASVILLGLKWKFSKQ